MGGQGRSLGKGRADEGVREKGWGRGLQRVESSNEAGMTRSSELGIVLEKEKNGLQHPREPRGSPAPPARALVGEGEGERATERLQEKRVIGTPFE